MGKSRIVNMLFKIKRHLLKQNRKSRHGGHCKYRGPKGTSCAIGCLIKDEFYDSIIEKARVNTTVVQTALSLSGYKKLSTNEIFLLSSAQTIHDHRSIDEWNIQLSNLIQRAKDNNPN